jgi:HK97 family phage major capsid protein
MSNKRIMPLVSMAALMAARPAGIVGSVRNEGPTSVEGLLKEVQVELKRIGDDVKRTAEDALKQSKQAGTATEEVKANADKLIVQFGTLSEAQGKLMAKLEALETKNTDLEQIMAGKKPGSVEFKNPAHVVADSDEMKAFIKNGKNGSMSIEVKQAITSATGSAGSLIWSERDTSIIDIPKRRMTIRDLIPKVQTSAALIEYAKLTTRTNNARVVTETAEKPESTYVWSRAEAPVRTIAHIAHISRQAMDDAAQLRGELENEMRYGYVNAEEQALLKGDGAGLNLTGLATAATAYSAAFTPTAAQMIDQLRLAILQVALQEYAATGLVLHPTDWTRIELMKEAGTNAYLWSNPRTSNGPGLWGLPVVDTTAQDQDEFLVGAFNVAATIYDRMGIEVLISSEHADNFIKNMLTMRVEGRLALAIKRPLSLVAGDFGFVT